MLGTTRQQPASGVPSRSSLIIALACASVVLLTLHVSPGLAAMGAVPALLAAISWKSERIYLLLSAAVLLHTGVSMQTRLEERQLQPAHLKSQRLEVLSVRPAGNKKPARLRVVLQSTQQQLLLKSWDAPWIPRPGQCIEADLRLRPPFGTRNFHGFDYTRWLFAEGVAATGSVRQMRPCAAEQATEPAAPSAFDALAPSPGRALLKALVLADRTEFDAAVWNTLARTGTSHLFAISGLHVGLIAALGSGAAHLIWLASAALRLRTPRRRVMVLGAACSVLGYMALAAGQVSAQRAGVSALLVLGLLWSGRGICMFRVWSLALLVVLLVNPFAILGPALGLSFAASLLLLCGLPLLRRQHFLVALLALQLMLGVGLAPLVAAYFGQWSLVGLGVNLLLVPALMLFLPMSLLAVAAAGVSAWPMQFVTAWLDAGYQLLVQLAALPQAVLVVDDMGFAPALAAVALFMLLLRSRSRRSAIGFGLAGLAVLVAARLANPTLSDSAVNLWVLDVGQGQAVAIQTAQHWVVVDAGPRSPRGSFDAGAMIVAPHLRARGAQRIDLLVVTHADIDHAGGAPALAQEFAIKRWWGSGGEDCEAELVWQADGVTLRSLPTGALPSWSDNNRSCVLALEAGGRRVLLSGDIEAKAEQALSTHLNPAGYDVVTVPHHGSASSSTARLVVPVRAKAAVISAGRFNRWGFPHPDVAERWQRSGAKLLNTADQGAIFVRLPGMEIQRPRQWPWNRE